MQKIRLLIVDDEQDCAESLARALDGDADVEVIATAKDGLDAVAKIETLKPDAVALDIVMPNLDGYGVLSNVDFTKLRKRPVFIVTSGLTGDAFIRKAINAGADYYMLKPVSPKALKERLVECSRVKYSPVAVKDDESEMRQAIRRSRHTLDEKLANIFISVGIPAHIKGYQFLREAIKMTIDRPEVINSITKKLYPGIAENFRTSPSKVERAIRHAIEVAWNRGKIENINQIFGIKIYSANDKPTNGEFIALLADKMIMEGAV